MKKLIFTLLLVPLVALATITPEAEFALNRSSGVAQKYQLGTLLHKNLNVVVGKYSYAVQGGSSTASGLALLSDLNDTASTITIPDNAVVKQVYIDVLTQPVGSSVALTLQSAEDLKASLAEGSFTGILPGIPVGTAATMIKLTADRTPVVVLSNPATAGKFNVYIEYALGD